MWTPAAAGLQFAWSGLGAVFLVLFLASAAVALAIVAYRSTEPQLARGPQTLLISLRASALLMIVLLLAEPVLHTRRDVEIPPSILLLVDDSASMAIEQADGRTRLDRALELRQRTAVALRKRPDARRVFVGQGSRRLLSSRLAEALPTPVASRLREGTDLNALLLSASQRHLEDNLRAILLLSDGKSTVDDPPSVAGLNIPVFTVAVADTAELVDLRLDRVRVPSFVHKGERVEIQAELVASAAPAWETHVYLESPGGVLDSLEVHLPAGGGRLSLRFVVEPDSLGLRRYLLRVPPRENEALIENNAAICAMEVRKDRLKTVHFSRLPDWNVHFLARGARLDGRFRYEIVHASEKGLRNAQSDSVWAPPQTLEEAKDIDLWIAGSVGDLNELLAMGVPLVQSVRAGAGLLVLAGEPSRHRPDPVAARASGILPLVPLPGSSWSLGRSAPELTTLARAHPVFNLEDSTRDLAEALRRLPPLWGVLSPLSQSDDADILLRASGSRQSSPLLAIREEGAGRVAFWAGGPLWSWSFWRLGEESSESFFRDFTGNLLYQLAEGGERERLRLLLPRPVIAEGQDLMLRALALDQRLQPDGEHDVWLEWAQGTLDPKDERTQALGRARMQLDPQTPGGRRLAMPALPAAAYSVRVALEEGDGRVVSLWQPLVVDPYSIEFQDPGADVAALGDIARQTGGRLLAGDELEDWAADIELVTRQATLSGRIDLWSSLWLFLPLLSLLTLEWSLRKRWGLI
jgi:hypothetical protein